MSGRCSAAVLAGLVMLLGQGCATEEGRGGRDAPEEPREEAPAGKAGAAPGGGQQGGDPRWLQEVALEHGVKLGGCTVGDVDPRQEGLEIAVTTAEGEVVVVSRDDDGWRHEVAVKLPGEMIQCDAGELDPELPGEELVCVGMARGPEGSGGPGAAYLVRREGGAWTAELIQEDAGLVHAVCIGDLDPARAGHELLIAGFSQRARVMVRRRGGWQRLASVGLPANAKGAAAARGGAVVGCDDGSLVAVHRTAQGWQADTLERFPDPLARLAGRGEHVLVCGNGGRLRLLAEGETTVLHREDDRLRGAVFAELLPGAGGLEAATAGYSGVITVAWREGGTWHTTAVGRDADRFHHLAAGELPDLGVCLVACGYGGRVVVVHRR